MKECPNCQSFNTERATICDDCGATLLDDPRVTVTRPTRTSARIALSRSDRDTDIGIQLLSILQSVTADGRISDSEVTELREWLTENRHIDMPSIAFLATTVDHILADGVVTDEERKHLYSAIERALPADLRPYAQLRRREARTQDRQAAKEVAVQRKLDAIGEKTRLREEEELRAPVLHMDFMVAGVAYEGRAKVIRQVVRGGMEAVLVRERLNVHSANAVLIRVNGFYIGYAPEDWAAELAPLLDGGHPFHAHVKKVLNYGRNPIPVIEGAFYRDAAHFQTATGHELQPVPANVAHQPSAVPPVRQTSNSSTSVWSWVIVALAAIVALSASC